MSKLLSINEIAKRVGVSVNAIRIRIGKGKFPAPTERKGKEMFWDESTLGGPSVAFSGTVSFDQHLTLYPGDTRVDRVKLDDVSLRSLGTSRVAQAIGRANRAEKDTKPVDVYVYGDPDGPVAIERSYRQFMRSYIHHPDYINRQQGLQVDAPDLSDPEVFRDVLQERMNALHKAQDDAQRYGLPTYGLYHPSNVLTLDRMAELPDDFGKFALTPIVSQAEAGVKACSGGCVDCKNKPTE